MRGPTHIAGGLIAGTVLFSAKPPDADAVHTLIIGGVVISAAVFGSIFPDIDHKGSTVSHKMRITSIMYRIVALLATILRIDGLEHRGVMHTVIFPIITLLCAVFIPNAIVSFILWAFFFGYLSHLFLDAFNPTGVPLFAPLLKLKIRFLPQKICIRTGSIFEFFVFVALIAVLVFVSIPILNSCKVLCHEIFPKIF